jgi:hypothetical protein
MEPTQNLWADNLPDADKSMGSTPGVETPLTPDEPDLLGDRNFRSDRT